MGSIYLRKYDAATTLTFSLYKIDGTALKTDAVSASGDIKIMKDEGAEANLAADAFVDEGTGYSLALSAAETQAARIMIYIVDQTNPQTWLDKSLIVETYGHASAQHAFDLDTATQNVNVASMDNIDFGAVQKASITAAVPTVAGIADGVWDEVITAAAHAVVDSPALYLRQLHQTIVSSVDQAQAGAAGSITLAAAESAVNDYFKGQLITITAGTGAGQSRACYDYTGATKVALIRPNWATNPDATSWYAIGNLGSAVVAAIEDIDFSATMLASLDAATPAVTVSDKTGFSLAADQSGVTIGTVNAATVADKTGFSLSAAGIDSILDEAVEGLITWRQAARLILAALAGKTSEAVAGTLVIRDANDVADRITATMDANRYRTGVVLNP